MALYDKIGPYLKTVQAGAGSLALILTTAGAAFGALSPKLAVGVATGAGVILTFNVWLVKNEALIEKTINAGGELYEAADDLYDRIHDQVSPKRGPTIKPVDPPVRGTEGWAFDTPMKPEPEQQLPLYYEPSSFEDEVTEQIPFGVTQPETAPMYTAASPDDPGRHSA
jgi:hypothetical protein